MATKFHDYNLRKDFLVPIEIIIQTQIIITLLNLR